MLLVETKDPQSYLEVVIAQNLLIHQVGPLYIAQGIGIGTEVPVALRLGLCGDYAMAYMAQRYDSGDEILNRRFESPCLQPWCLTKNGSLQFTHYPEFFIFSFALPTLKELIGYRDTMLYTERFDVSQSELRMFIELFSSAFRTRDLEL